MARRRRLFYTFLEFFLRPWNSEKIELAYRRSNSIVESCYCYRLHGIFDVYLFVLCNLLIVAGEMLQSRGSLRDLCNYSLGGDGKTEFQLKKYP